MIASEESPPGCGLLGAGFAGWVRVSGGVVSHPPIRPPARAGAMTMYSGDRAAQSVRRARRGRLRQIFELTRGHATPSGAVTALLLGARRVRGCGVPGADEHVPGAGEQLAGDGGGGDLLPAPLRNALEGGCELRGAAWRSARPHPAPSAATPSLPRGCAHSRRPRSLPRTVGVSPAHDASLRAEANRLMSPASARMTSAVNGP